MKIHINKSVFLVFDCFEDSKTIVKPFTRPFKYIYHSCMYNDVKYYIRMKEQFQNNKWVVTSKSFAVDLNAKKWESKLSDIIK